jgi:hypothetical protein
MQSINNSQQMKESLEPDDLDLLKRYDAEQEEIEAQPPAAIELPANQALALITYIQIGAANPAVEHNPLLPSAIAAAKQIQSSFNPNSAIHEVLELGWQEPQESDKIVPHQIFTSTPCRPKKLRPAP